MRVLLIVALSCISVSAQTVPTSSLANGVITISTGDAIIAGVDWQYIAPQTVNVILGTPASIYISDGSDGNPSGTLIVGDPTGETTCSTTCLVMPWTGFYGISLGWFDGINLTIPIQSAAPDSLMVVVQ